LHLTNLGTLLNTMEKEIWTAQQAQDSPSQSRLGAKFDHRPSGIYNASAQEVGKQGWNLASEEKAGKFFPSNTCFSQ